MNDEFVDSLYKYRSVDSFTLDIIANNRIFFAKPEMFNDPYDTEFNINTHIGKLSFYRYGVYGRNIWNFI